MTTCQGETKDGDGCRAPAQPGRPFCIHHDPALEDKRRSWRREGGRARAYDLRPPASPLAAEVSFATPADVRRLLEGVTRALLAGELTERRATAVGFLAQVALKTDEAEVMERLAALEERLGVA